MLWDPQYARSKAQAQELASLATSVSGEGAFIPANADLGAVGITAILRKASDLDKVEKNSDGHWHLKGRAINLGQLLEKCGKEFSAYENYVLVPQCDQAR